MKGKAFWLLLNVTVLLLVGSIGAWGQSPSDRHLSGSINDYTPANVAGPWQISGQWSLDLKGNSGTADFSAALTMARSDLGVMLNGGGNLDDPTQRHTHTHHVILIGGTVTALANGFEVAGVLGAVTITGNGNFPPLFGGSSTVTIDVTGGNNVSPSNIKLTFGGDAATHFGSQPINGVVQSNSGEGD